METPSKDYAIFCTGTGSNIRCPFCGKNNTNVCHGIPLEFGKYSVFAHPCYSCEKVVYYQAGYEISVWAEKNDFLRGKIPYLGPRVIKKFMLIFSDLLQGCGNRSQSRVVYGLSVDDVVEKFGLIERETRPFGFWDGSHGEVVISVQEICEEELNSQEALRDYASELTRCWY